MQEKVLHLLNDSVGFVKASEIFAVGVTARQIQRMVENGEILRIKRGYYQFADPDEPNEAVMIAKLFPEAVICMDTALFYYGYSDRTPLEWHLSVSRKISKSRFKLSYPAVKPYYIDEKFLDIGITVLDISGQKMKIYDRERVICDYLRHKNKIDSEMFNKAIQAYLRDSKKNIRNLSSYAKQLRVHKKARDLIGVWL